MGVSSGLSRLLSASNSLLRPPTPCWFIRSAAAAALGGVIREDEVRRTRTSNPRRPVIDGPGETSCLSLCWAVLDLFISGARGLGLTDLDRQQLDTLRTERKSGERTCSLAESA